jgi:hypothetical protein
MHKSDTQVELVYHLFVNEKIVNRRNEKLIFYSFHDTISKEPVPGNIGGELSISLSS